MKNEKRSYGEINDLNLKLIIALARTNQSFQKQGAAHFKEWGLTTAQFGVLEALYHKGDLRIAEIIEKTLSTGGNMTVVINNLEKQGLLEKHKDPDDKRATLVRITERGKDLMDDLFPEHIKFIEKTYDVLTMDEKKILITLLKKMSGL